MESDALIGPMKKTDESICVVCIGPMRVSDSY